eukprot:4466571-Lingulodinium_polyedra.AAC.1
MQAREFTFSSSARRDSRLEIEFSGRVCFGPPARCRANRVPGPGGPACGRCFSCRLPRGGMMSTRRLP